MDAYHLESILKSQLESIIHAHDVDRFKNHTTLIHASDSMFFVEHEWVWRLLFDLPPHTELVLSNVQMFKHLVQLGGSHLDVPSIFMILGHLIEYMKSVPYHLATYLSLYGYLVYTCGGCIGYMYQNDIIDRYLEYFQQHNVPVHMFDVFKWLLGMTLDMYTDRFKQDQLEYECSSLLEHVLDHMCKWSVHQHKEVVNLFITYQVDAFRLTRSNKYLYEMDHTGTLYQYLQVLRAVLNMTTTERGLDRLILELAGSSCQYLDGKCIG